MTDLATLIHRIDQEFEAEVTREKTAWEDVARANRERAPRLQRYDAVAKHVLELLKPRLAAFLERFQDVA